MRHIKEKIDVLILSDIHLGSRLSRIYELLNVLSKYKFNKLILNGDIFDDLNFKRLNHHHWKVLSKIRDISSSSEVVWISGNHDGETIGLSHLIGVKIYTKYMWKNNGNTYLAIHGNQFDRFLYKNVFISAIAVSLYRAIKRLDTKNTIISNWIKRKSRSWLRMSKEVKRGAIIYAKLKGANFIFCGHTHIPEHSEKMGVHYYNSGSWLETPSSYITINKNEVLIVKV